jgi:hypothetical protein
MPEPTTNDPPEPVMTSAVIDDVEVFAAPDQWPTPDLSDLDLEDES